MMGRRAAGPSPASHQAAEPRRQGICAHTGLSMRLVKKNCTSPLFVAVLPYSQVGATKLERSSGLATSDRYSQVGATKLGRSSGRATSYRYSQVGATKLGRSSGLTTSDRYSQVGPTKLERFSGPATSDRYSQVGATKLGRSSGLGSQRLRRLM